MEGKRSPSTSRHERIAHHITQTYARLTGRGCIRLRAVDERGDVYVGCRRKAEGLDLRPYEAAAIISARLRAAGCYNLLSGFGPLGKRGLTYQGDSVAELYRNAVGLWIVQLAFVV